MNDLLLYIASKWGDFLRRKNRDVQYRNKTHIILNRNGYVDLQLYVPLKHLNGIYDKHVHLHIYFDEETYTWMTHYTCPSYLTNSKRWVHDHKKAKRLDLFMKPFLLSTQNTRDLIQQIDYMKLFNSIYKNIMECRQDSKRKVRNTRTPINRILVRRQNVKVAAPKRSPPKSRSKSPPIARPSLPYGTSINENTFTTSTPSVGTYKIKKKSKSKPPSPASSALLFGYS